MMKAYKFRIYPDKEQQYILVKWFGAARYVWNWGLHQIKDNYQHTEMMEYSWGGDLATYNYEDALTMKFHGCKDSSSKLFKMDAVKCSRMLTPAKTRKIVDLPDGLKHMSGLKDNQPWLNDVPDKILRYSLRNLGTAFRNFFTKNTSGNNSGHPKPKKLSGNQSIQFDGTSVKLNIKSGIIYIPRIKNIEIRLHRPIIGKIKTTTISKTKSGKYFISFQVDTGENIPATKPIREENIVGIDVGITTYATLSNGEKIDGIRPFRESEKRLGVLGKRFSRKKSGSKNQEKARIKLAKCHEKIANQRSDFQNKLSRKLVDDYDAIAIESLNIAGMIKNRHLAKSISDASWSEFVRQIKYKAIWSGKTVIEIGRWEATSKLCHVCGHKEEKMSLDIREWKCPKCGSIHDRDINAAINIKTIGIDQLYKQ